jgi:hypothetical protein
MARTLGAKNRTPREKATEGRYLIKVAKLEQEIAALKKKQAGPK